MFFSGGGEAGKICDAKIKCTLRKFRITEGKGNKYTFHLKVILGLITEREIAH